MLLSPKPHLNRLLEAGIGRVVALPSKVIVLEIVWLVKQAHKR